MKRMDLHVNPLKPHLVMAVNNAGHIIRQEAEAISWRDAAIVSSVLTAGAFFTVYLTSTPYQDLVGNLGLCIYNAVVFIGKTWFTNFIALAGLGRISQSLARARPGESSTPSSSKTTPGA